jgi:hypothetical protein
MSFISPKDPPVAGQFGSDVPQVAPYDFQFGKVFYTNLLLQENREPLLQENKRGILI